MANQLNARRRNAQTFWARKLEAYETYGRALSRPQDNFRNYMLAKRRINYGYDTRTQQNLHNIMNFPLNTAALPLTPDDFNMEAVPLQNFHHAWVDSDESFTLMMRDLVQQREIALDIECNEHSFFGMICLLQISTHTCNYLLDPFVMLENIQQRLRPVLEHRRCVKVVHGCGNDIIAFSRDLNLNLAAVVDTQHVYQQLIRVTLGYVQNGQAEATVPGDFQSILWRATRHQTGRQKTTAEMLLETNQLISLTNLTNLFIPHQQHPPASAQLADWRIRPITNPNMLRYSVFDSFILLKIWNKMKVLIRAQPDGDIILQRALEKTTTMVSRHFVPAAEQTVENAIQLAGVASPLRPLFSTIFAWRQNYAKMVDECPNEILSLTEMLTIISTRATTEQAIRDIVGRRQIPCESIDNWVGLVTNLTLRGEEFWRHLQTIKCHACFSNGRNQFPHAHVAFGCAAPYSTAATRAYFNDPSNEAERARREESTRRRWAANHGDKPFPGAARRN